MLWKRNPWVRCLLWKRNPRVRCCVYKTLNHFLKSERNRPLQTKCKIEASIASVNLNITLWIDIFAIHSICWCETFFFSDFFFFTFLEFRFVEQVISKLKIYPTSLAGLIFWLIFWIIKFIYVIWKVICKYVAIMIQCICLIEIYWFLKEKYRAPYISKI